MVSGTSSSDVCAPNVERGPISYEDLLRGVVLALRAGGRKEKTLLIYEDSIRMFSEFARPSVSQGSPQWTVIVSAIG